MREIHSDNVITESILYLLSVLLFLFIRAEPTYGPYAI